MRKKSLQASLILLSLGLLVGLVLFPWDTKSRPRRVWRPSISLTGPRVRRLLSSKCPRSLGRGTFHPLGEYPGPTSTRMVLTFSPQSICTTPSTLWINDDGQFLVRCATFSGRETGSTTCS